MSDLLPLTIRRRCWEPAHAALARHSARSGVADVLIHGRRLGFTFPDLLNGRAVEPFAGALGFDPRQLLAATPVVSATTRTVALGAEVVRLGDWSTRSRRVCPVCVEEDAVQAREFRMPPEWWVANRSWWDVRSVDACALHAVRLVDTCRTCGAAIPWASALLRCRCGGTFATSAEPCDSAVSRYLTARLRGEVRAPVPVLDVMTFRDAVRTMELLGASRLGHRLVKPRRSDAEAVIDRNSGLEMALGWPQSFERTLDALLAGRRRDAPAGLLGTYGWLHSEICKGEAPAAASLLVEPVLLSHAVRHGVIALGEDRPSRPGVSHGSVTALARQVGRSYAKTRSLLAEANAIPEGSRRGVPFVIDPASVDRYRRKPGLRRRLGVGKSQARRVHADGELAVEVGRLGDDDVLAALARVACAGVAASSVPIPLACRNMSFPLAVVCAAALRREFKVWRCPSSTGGLSSYAVDPRDLRSLRRETGLLSLDAISLRQRIHPDAVRSLSRSGAFGPRSGGAGHAWEAVAAFFLEHVTAAELASSRGTSSKSLRDKLLANGIQPAFGPPTCRQLLYRRSDVGWLR